MANIHGKGTIEAQAVFVLSEAEMRALDALVGYGTNAFLEVFYAKMGRAYLEPHEAGLRTLFESIRNQIPSILDRVDGAREIFNGKKQNAKTKAETE